MVKDFKGQVKVADVQAAFDEIIGKVNSLVESYNVQGSVEDIDYTIGGANLAPSGYTLSVGGMKQFLKACEGCVVGGKPFKVNDTHIKMSTGMVVSLAGIQRLPDSVLTVGGRTLWWDSYNKRYTWTGTVPRKDYFTFKEEGGVWYTYLNKGTYTITYKNPNTDKYEPKQITLNSDLRFPIDTASVHTDILKPSSSGEVPITVITATGVKQKNTDIETGFLYGKTVYSGNNFNSLERTSSYVTITPKDTAGGLLNEELSYTWKVPYTNYYTSWMGDLYLHFNIEVTRTNSDGSEEVLDIEDFTYNVPAYTHSKDDLSFSKTIKLDRPLEYGETIDITISDIDSRFNGQASVPGNWYGIWSYYEYMNSLATMDVHLYSEKSVAFTNKINLVVEANNGITNYTLDSLNIYKENYSDLGYFTWDTKAYADRPFEWSYVEDTSTPEFKEISEGMYRICDINMNTNSKFVGTNVNTQNERIYGTYKITNQTKNYANHWVQYGDNNGAGSPWYQKLDTSEAPKFVIGMPAEGDGASKHGGGSDAAAFLFGEEVVLNTVQHYKANQYWLPATYLYVPKGAKNPYTYFNGRHGSTDPKYSSQKVLNVKIDKRIKSENK